jgi:hypothetical protein
VAARATTKRASARAGGYAPATRVTRSTTSGSITAAGITQPRRDVVSVSSRPGTQARPRSAVAAAASARRASTPSMLAKEYGP